MNTLTHEYHTTAQLSTLKRYAATVYLCQILTFMLAGMPLLIGVGINFYKRDEVQGTWLQSHFDWQIKTCWVALAGFAISGLTFAMGVGMFVLLVTVVWMVYRIIIGWYALTDDKAVTE